MEWQQIFYYIGAMTSIGITSGLLTGRVPLTITLFTFLSIMIDGAVSIMTDKKTNIPLSMVSAALLGIVFGRYI